MANILYRTSNGAYTNIDGVLTPTKEYPEAQTSFPVGLQRSNSYIKGTPLSATEIDTNFYQLAAESNHVAYCDTEGSDPNKVVRTTYFPLESGAHISIRFTNGNTALNPTLTVKVPNANDDDNYTTVHTPESNWICYGPFPIFMDADESISATNAGTEVQLEEGCVYDFFYDDYDIDSQIHSEDSKTNREHRWRMKSNGEVHKSGIESIPGFKTFTNGLAINDSTSSNILLVNNGFKKGELPSGDTYSSIIFGDRTLRGYDANKNLEKGLFGTFVAKAYGAVTSGVDPDGIVYTRLIATHMQDTSAQVELHTIVGKNKDADIDAYPEYVEIKRNGQGSIVDNFKLGPWIQYNFKTHYDGSQNWAMIRSPVLYSGYARIDNTHSGSMTTMLGSNDATIIGAGSTVVSQAKKDIRYIVNGPVASNVDPVATWNTATILKDLFLVSDGTVTVRPGLLDGSSFDKTAPKAVFKREAGYTNVDLTGTQYSAIEKFADDFPNWPANQRVLIS